jgi:hypothetical protein
MSPHLRKLHSSCQYNIDQLLAVTESLYCITTIFILYEAMLSVFELDSTIFAAFHDIMRDFDTVWHAALINKLKPIGIKG